jgi:hypothetical protein
MSCAAIRSSELERGSFDVGRLLRVSISQYRFATYKVVPRMRTGRATAREAMRFDIILRIQISDRLPTPSRIGFSLSCSSCREGQ